MSRHRQSYVVYESDESSSDYGPPIRVERTKGHHNHIVKVGSDYGGSQKSHKSRKISIQRDSSPAPVVVENYLSIPNARPRASSQGAAPQPNFIPVYVPQAPSRSGSRHRRRSEYSDSDDSYRSGSRGRHRPSSTLSVETQAQLAKLRLKEEEEAREAAESAALAKYEERQRKQSERDRVTLLEAEDKRKRERAELDAQIAAAEDKKKKEKAELEARIAAAEAKRRAEEAEEKEHRMQIIREEREKEAKKKKEDEEMRKQILREEEERLAKEKEKKKKEEEEFNQKVKERFMKAGYDPEYIEDILAEKKKKKDLAIDLSRPTYIRVQRKHLYPDTLDFYGLPWEYDSTDSRYIIIKKYLSHDFQQELFKHTETIRIKKEKLRITDGEGTGYTKETITTLKPTDVYRDKDKDEMYVVRRKSTSGRSRSRSVNRRSWMFT